MIPKTIHYCWLSGDAYPELAARCIKTWQERLPDYKLVLWDKHKFDIEKNIWVKEAFENKKYTYAADYIRLFAMYNEGGIYLDSDVQVIKDFSPLLSHQSFMGHDAEGDLEAAIIGARAGTEWVEKCLEYYHNRRFRRPDGTLDLRTVPDIIADILKREYQIKTDAFSTATIEKAGLTLYPWDYFSPKNAYLNKTVITQNTYTIHHFDGSWVDKNFRYHAKVFIHKTIILLLGQKIHNILLRKIRHANNKH
jgi:mannosyltransferase OCH1-like enzyme